MDDEKMRRQRRMRICASEVMQTHNISDVQLERWAARMFVFVYSWICEEEGRSEERATFFLFKLVEYDTLSSSIPADNFDGHMLHTLAHIPARKSSSAVPSREFTNIMPSKWRPRCGMSERQRRTFPVDTLSSHGRCQRTWLWRTRFPERTHASASKPTLPDAWHHFVVVFWRWVFCSQSIDRNERKHVYSFHVRFVFRWKI